MNNLALITGGAKRVGAVMATALAKMGYDVAITYRDSKNEAISLCEKLGKYGVHCKAYKLDLFDIAAVKKFGDEFFVTNKNCSVLINNASIFQKSNFIDSDFEELDENFNVHVKSPLLLSRSFSKSADGGHIINMIDKNTARYDTSYFHYLLSKKFLLEATKMLSLQLAPRIRVNGISPGYILDAIDGANVDDKAKIINKIPLQRQGDVGNIIQSLKFLLENDFITGQIISIDGGASLNHAG
ncbi:MAG: SDR family oxidoreductase [Rickettsiales bacterium]|nr:SDR family oxidoreductase [Rickettsiales bacterium]